MLAAMPFHDRLRELRKAAGMTQEALARVAGISTSTVAKLEHSGVDPSWSTVTMLANALGVGTDAFKDEPKPAPTKKRRKPTDPEE